MIVFAVGWEYYPGTRIWLPIVLLIINARGILREIENLPKARARFASNGFLGLASRKKWIAWVMGAYGVIAIIFFVLAITRSIDTSSIGFLQLLFMLAPLGIPGTVIYYENLGEN